MKYQIMINNRKPVVLKPKVNIIELVYWKRRIDEISKSIKSAATATAMVAK
jgi:hypothetical protein